MPTMGDDPPPLIASAFKEYTILGALKTDLQGLVYWWERHQEVPRTLEEGARGLWHLAARVNHADILFTGKRRPDSLEGAVFRTLRDLGVPELGDPFRQALSAPASASGLSLDKVIKRMRNAFAHRSHDLQQHGDDFAFWRLSQSNASFQAFSTLHELRSGPERKSRRDGFYWQWHREPEACQDEQDYGDEDKHARDGERPHRFNSLDLKCGGCSRAGRPAQHYLPVHGRTRTRRCRRKTKLWNMSSR